MTKDPRNTNRRKVDGRSRVAPMLTVRLTTEEEGAYKMLCAVLGDEKSNVIGKALLIAAKELGPEALLLAEIREAYNRRTEEAAKAYPGFTIS